MKMEITWQERQHFFKVSNDKLWSLFYILDEYSFPILLMEEIEKDISDKNYITYTFNKSGFNIIDQNTLEIIEIFDDSEKSKLRISVPAFWKALYNYEKIMEKEWHKITITYDGNEVHFEVE